MSPGTVESSDQGYYNPFASPDCNTDCTIDWTVCEPYGYCGDLVVQGGFGEECDGSMTTTCGALGFTGNPTRTVQCDDETPLDSCTWITAKVCFF